MRDKFDKILIDIYQRTDDSFFLKRSDRFNELASAAADRQLAKVKHDIVKKRWQKVKLQNKLDDLKQNHSFAAENDKN